MLAFRAQQMGLAPILFPKNRKFSTRHTLDSYKNLPYSYCIQLNINLAGNACTNMLQKCKTKSHECTFRKRSQKKKQQQRQCKLNNMPQVKRAAFSYHHSVHDYYHSYIVLHLWVYKVNVFGEIPPAADARRLTVAAGCLST